MKKFLIVVLSAIAIGGGAAYFLFNKIVVKAESPDMVMVSAFQIGAFTNYDNAVKVADRNNGIVVNDEDIYRVFVAVLNDKEAVSKLSDYYAKIGLHYYMKQVMVKSEFVKKISAEEELMKRSSDEVYGTINKEILKIYKEML